MDEPWWEGRVASDVHCTLREKVSPSLPLSLAGTGYLESLSPSRTCLQDTPRGNSELFLSFYLCACPFTFTRSVVFPQEKDQEIKKLEVVFFRSAEFQTTK